MPDLIIVGLSSLGSDAFPISKYLKLFKDFFTTIRLFITLWFMGFVLLFINTFAVINPFAYIVMSIILFYFSVYLVVLIFLYFDKKYAGGDEQ